MCYTLIVVNENLISKGKKTMSKEVKDEVQSTRQEKMSKAEHLANLKELRRKGILTRQQFRLLTWDKQLQGSTKGVPLFTEFELTKDSAEGKVVTGTLKQWTRI